jgi:hypothetical protein
MPCIVCQREEANPIQGTGDFWGFECPRCGVFSITGSAKAELRGKFDELPLRRSLMSHTLRRMQRPDNRLPKRIDSYDLHTYWGNEKLPTPQQQADSLILWIGDNQETAFEVASIKRTAIAAWIGLPISLPDDTTGWVWLNDELTEQQLYQSNVREGNVLLFRLTMKGMGEIPESKKDRDRKSNGIHGIEIQPARS